MIGAARACVIAEKGAAPTPGAAPAYSSSGTGAAVSLGALSPTQPATIAAGDLLIMHALAYSGDNDTTFAIDTPTGWTAFAGNPYNAAGKVRVWAFSRPAVGDEDGASVACTSAGQNAPTGTYAQIHRFTAADGFHPTTPIRGIAFVAGSGTSLSMPTVTPDGGGQLAVALAALCDGTNGGDILGNSTGESGGDWTQAAEFSSAAASDGTLQVQTSDQSGGGAVSGGTTTSSLSEAWGILSFRLAPANV
jgi:hypothetical protein